MAGEPTRAAAPALAGRTIVVTRPAHQATELADLIRAAGGNAIVFPVLEILDAEDLKPLMSVIDRLDDFDFAVFISPNAVNKAMNLIQARRRLPEKLRVAAIGKGSARALREFGISEVIAPGKRMDSEALLELPELEDVAGKRVVIFRGDGGRELLGDTLMARGATLEYAECYRRARPALDPAPLMRAWARNEIDAITVTSSEGLRNLYDMVGKLGQQWLKKTPLFVPHERIAETARDLGLACVVLTAPGDAGLVQGLARWFANPDSGQSKR
ncbi:MAG: uroporphyrinogen-III synthase [Betaproteobacteria bacterium]|nr:uroporphyrinogen-III synthase [Betaproteobacteria bacterium]